jgi:hypothetical protein
MFNCHRKEMNFSLIPAAEHLNEIPHQLTGLEFIATDLYEISVLIKLKLKPY